MPILKNLPDAYKECTEMFEAARNYDILDLGPNEMYRLDDDPSLERCKDAIHHISSRLKDNRNQNYLIMYFFVGHGVQDGGSQCLLLNEFNEDTGYYQHWDVESSIRDLAKNNQNIY